MPELPGIFYGVFSECTTVYSTKQNKNGANLRHFMHYIQQSDEN